VENEGLSVKNVLTVELQDVVDKLNDISESFTCLDRESKANISSAVLIMLVDSTSQGIIDGYSEGYEDGYTDGCADGHEDGYSKGYKEGVCDGHQDGYDEGFDDGYNEGLDEGSKE
jgi:flagellar biosynthesis/type III secretory pathway protein FliH